MSSRVVVIGAGIVGVCTAIELRKRGQDVVLVDQGLPGGTQAASYGNGAWISPSSVVPMSTPGLWKKVPGFLLDATGPLTIRWHALPRLAPWLWRFVRAGATEARVQATARALSALLHDAPTRHLALAGELGDPEMILPRGLLYVYPERRHFLDEALGWRLRRDNHVQWEEWDAPTLHDRVPGLDARYGFGVWVGAGAHCADPGGYVAALARYAVGLGVTLERRRVTALHIDGGRLRGVRTDKGELACDRAVIAAGVHGKALAREAGDRVHLESERGYHISIVDSGVSLAYPVMPSDGKMANTPTRSGFRSAGQVELCSIDAAPDWRRADILLEHARRAYPALRRPLDEANVARWMGHRPSSADGLPYIGQASGCPDVYHAFGHGHVGLASAPATAQLVGDLLLGVQPSIDPRPYRVNRV